MLIIRFATKWLEQTSAEIRVNLDDCEVNGHEKRALSAAKTGNKKNETEIGTSVD
jgi:hypothetical protein